MESSAAELWHEGATGWETAAVLGDQVEFSCSGDSLGAVGCAELAEDVADVLLTVSRVTASFPGEGLVRRACGQHPQHLQLAAGQLLGQACWPA